MTDINFEEEFTKLTTDLQMPTPEAVGAVELLELVESLHEVCAVLTYFVSSNISGERDTNFPEGMTTAVPALKFSALALAEEVREAIWGDDCCDCDCDCVDDCHCDCDCDCDDENNNQ